MSYLQRLRETFWFFPAVMCILAAVAAQGLTSLDRRLDDDASQPGVLLYEVGAAGSRSLLESIAGSMLAVASTTFSITIAVLALTSSTYGPRLVRNFMADRGNQLVLGTYVATYVYTLLVLRSVRSLEEGDDSTFVPHLAVNGAVLLAIVSIGVLVWFIHHIADSIQVWTLAGRVHGELRAVVEDLYPEHLGDEPSHAETGRLREALTGPVTATVTAAKAGYVQRVEDDRLLELAQEEQLVVELLVRPGSFVVERGAVAHVRGRLEDEDATAKRLRRCLHLGSSRSPYQDVEYAVQQLVEMAVRALSPSTNDPYTALNALDELSDGLAAMARRSAPSPARLDGDGAVRVVAPGVVLADLVELLVDAMRGYACDHPDVVDRTITVLDRVGNEAPPASRRHLLEQAELLLDQYRRTDPHPRDLSRVGDHVAATRVRLAPA